MTISLATTISREMCEVLFAQDGSLNVTMVKMENLLKFGGITI